MTSVEFDNLLKTTAFSNYLQQKNCFQLSNLSGELL